MCILFIYTMLKVVSYYDLSFLSMSVIGSQKRFDMGEGGWVGSALCSFILDFWNFSNCKTPKCLCPGTIRVVGASLLTSATFVCHLRRSSAALLLLLKSRPVQSLMLSSHLFFCLTLFLWHSIVPCKIFLQTPLDLTTSCPNHRYFLFHSC